MLCALGHLDRASIFKQKQSLFAWLAACRDDLIMSLLLHSWNVTTRKYKYDEVWHDGVTLAAAKDEVARLRKELEAANRQIASMSQNLRREKKRKGSAAYHQLVECEETLKIRARDLADKLKGAQDSLTRMNREKKTVTRRATRLRMQADSLFFREAGGMVLNRRYAILSLIGQGGFAQVYRCGRGKQ
jgi:hypothetical protein